MTSVIHTILYMELNFPYIVSVVTTSVFVSAKCFLCAFFTALVYIYIYIHIIHFHLLHSINIY